MKEIAKWIVGLAAMFLITALLSTFVYFWVAWAIGLLACYLILGWSNIFDGDSLSDSIAIVIALALFCGVIGGLWWFYLSVFQPWINRLTDNENMGAYVMCAVFALAFVVGLVFMIAAAVKRNKKDKQCQKEKSEAGRLADEDEQIQQQLAAVKGNWLKKEMIARKLKRQYVEQKLGEQTSAYHQAMSKWDFVYDLGNAALNIGLSPLIWVLIIGGFVFWGWAVYAIDTKWMAILNVALAFTAALVLTLRRHGYLAFLMWMAFFLYAFGVWHVGGDTMLAYNQWMQQEGYDAITLSHYDNRVSDMQNKTYALMMLTSICFALYSAIKRWTVPLWCVFAFVLCVIDDNGLLFGVVSIVKLYLGIPASSFL